MWLAEKGREAWQPLPWVGMGRGVGQTLVLLVLLWPSSVVAVFGRCVGLVFVAVFGRCVGLGRGQGARLGVVRRRGRGGRCGRGEGSRS